MPIEVQDELPHFLVALVGVSKHQVWRVNKSFAKDRIGMALVVNYPFNGRPTEVASQFILPVLEAVS
jgi:hypothetical protein